MTTTTGPERTSSVRVRGVPAWAVAAIGRLAVAARVTPAQAARLALVRGLLAWEEAYPSIRTTGVGAGEEESASPALVWALLAWGEAYPSLAPQATPEEEDDDLDDDDIAEREAGAWGVP